MSTLGASTSTDSTTNSSSQTSNQIPQWVQDAGKQNYAYAQSLAMQPLQQYQGQTVADTSPQTQQAWDLAANSGNVGQAQYGAANTGYLNTLGTTPQQVTAMGIGADQVHDKKLAATNLNPYMNPYTQSVINTTLPIMQQNLGLQQLGVANNATQNSAFGGSRMGVEQGVTQAQGAQNMANMAAGLNSANYTQAVQGATGDITRGLQAQEANQAANLTASQANQAAALKAAMSNQSAGLTQEDLNNKAATGLTGLGNAYNTANLANYGMLTTSGAQQSAQQQAGLNADKAKFEEARNYPYQGLGVMESTLGMTPYNTASTTQGTSNTQGTSQQSPDYMGLAFKGLDFLSGLSDRSMKTDITPMGKDPETGIPLHAFRYKGDPKSYPKVVGPMAQDVAKTMPGAVKTVGSNGKLAVASSVMGALTPPASGGFYSGLTKAPKLASSVMGMPPSMMKGATTNPRAGARGVRGALANTKRRLPGIAGALG